MAAATTPTTKAGQEGQQAAPGGSRGMGKLVLGALVVLAIGAGGGGYVVATVFSDTPANAREAGSPDGATAAHEEGEGAHVGPTIVSLGDFTVNLRGSGGARVLRVEVEVEVDPRHAHQIEAARPMLRDAVITLASDYTVSELDGLNGKTRLRDELIGRINAKMTDASVDRLFFTEFVIQ